MDKEINSKIDLTKDGHLYGDRIEVVTGDGYELDVSDGKVFFTRKKIEYPGTFNECNKVLGMRNDFKPSFPEHLPVKNIGYKTSANNEFSCLYRLKVCRDAYWMCHDNWNIDEADEDECFYSIGFRYGVPVKFITKDRHHYLSFPTHEMRDAFFKNFYEWVKCCGSWFKC